MRNSKVIAILALGLTVTASLSGRALAQSSISPDISPLPKAWSGSDCHSEKLAVAEHLGVPCSAIKKSGLYAVDDRAQSPSIALVNGSNASDSDRKARLFLIRDYAEPVIYPAAVYIDDRKVVSLWQHDFSELDIPAGPHQISVRWIFLARQPAFDHDLSLLPGHNYYFKIDAQSRVEGRFLHMVNGLRQLPEPEAIILMKNCCKQKVAILQ